MSVNDLSFVSYKSPIAPGLELQLVEQQLLEQLTCDVLAGVGAALSPRRRRTR